MFAFLFVIAFVPTLLVCVKISRKKSLNIFDISIIFSGLYFVAIPVNDFLFNHVHPEYINNTHTAIAVCIYMWMTYAVSFLLNGKKKSPLSFTNKLSEIKSFNIADGFQWFALVYIAYMLFQTTNYSSLSKNNLEGNINFFYGLNQSFFLRMIHVSFRQFFPALFLIILHNRPQKTFYKKIRILNIVLIIATLLLGNKGFMIFNSVFLILYYYSVNRHSITKKQMLFCLSLFCLLFAFIFPLSQSFRYYKQDAVSRPGDHSFQTIAKNFVQGGVDERLKERVDEYERERSLNLYDAVDFSASRTKFRGNGLMSMMVLKYIIPQRITDDSNIMAILMLGGGDVGESILAWYVLDWGYVLGPIIAVIHLLLISLLYYYFGAYFLRWIKSPLYLLVVYTIILRIVVGVEHNPSTDIKMLYNTYYLIIIFVGAVFYLYKAKSCKR